ncbi:hypothetical protein ABKN59_006786 [Abortiporus biennis]
MASRQPSPASTIRRRGNALAVRIEEPPPSTNHSGHQLRKRKEYLQRRWELIKDRLPPQLTREHIGMISIGGVIGTGLFIGSGTALYHGGPIGAFLGYLVIGSVVYSLCVSIGEMIAFLPNIGGVVGLADLYVDKALGFSLGWAAWYNWSVTLPAEVSAAVLTVQFWHSDESPMSDLEYYLVAGLFLLAAIAINCFPSRIYGRFEYWFSTIKVVTMVAIIIMSIFLDLGASPTHDRIGFRYWKKHVFSPNFYGIGGSLGHFLGFWAVLMQACFSFFGAEVPGIAAGEVIDATRNVPRALKRVWIKITLFYISSVFFAGLLVDCTDPRLQQGDNSSRSSPFVIALLNAKVTILPSVINAAILLSAWSAAASDVYISSRFLFFLAERGHAPAIFGLLLNAKGNISKISPPPGDESSDIEDNDELPVINITFENSSLASSSVQTPSSDTEERPGSLDKNELELDEVDVQVHDAESLNHDRGLPRIIVPIPSYAPTSSQPIKKPSVLPLPAVLASSAMGFLVFLGAPSSNTTGPSVIFDWMVAVTSVASLQSWAGMLYTYIRWYRGTVYAENKSQIEDIKIHRHAGQPYLAYYAFSICMLILITNGWTVFIHNSWRIADIPQHNPTPPTDQSKFEPNPVSTFLSSYVPLPFFILLTYGTKVPEYDEPRPQTRRERFVWWILGI